MNALLSALIGVWIIVGNGANCSKDGCAPDDTYWTGAGWSHNWKDARQYPYGMDVTYVIPNGQHCCYSEVPTRIDPKTGTVLGYGPAE